MIYLIRQPINIGSTPNDGNGDTVRSAFNKVNINEAVLFDNQISLLDTANAIFVTANVAYNASNPNTINSIFMTANAAYNAANPDRSNTIFVTANAAFDQANTALSASNPNTINSIFITTNSAFDKANAAYNLANTGGGSPANTAGANGYFSIPVSIANTQNPGYGLYVDWRNTSFNAVRATSNQSSAVWGESYGAGAGITGKEYTYGSIGHLGKDGYGVYTPDKSYFGNTVNVFSSTGNAVSVIANSASLTGYGMFVDWSSTNWIGIYAKASASVAIAGVGDKAGVYGGLNSGIFGQLGRQANGIDYSFYGNGKSYFGDNVSIASSSNGVNIVANSGTASKYGINVDWTNDATGIGIASKCNNIGIASISDKTSISASLNNGTYSYVGYNDGTNNYSLYGNSKGRFGDTLSVSSSSNGVNIVANAGTNSKYGISVDWSNDPNGVGIGVKAPTIGIATISNGAGVSAFLNNGTYSYLPYNDGAGNNYSLYGNGKGYFGDGVGVKTPSSGYGLYVDWSSTSWNAIRAKSNQSSALWAESIGTGGGAVGRDSSGALGVLGYSGYGVYTGNNMYCGGSLTQKSDARLKENVNNLSGALKIIQQMRPVSFDWKPETSNGSKHDFGLLAQDVENIIPEIVQEVTIPDFTEGDNLEKSLGTIKSVDYVKIVPFLIAALQELKEEFEEYKKTHP